MTIALELSAREEAVLRRKAALKGLDIKGYLMHMAQGDVDHDDIEHRLKLVRQMGRPGVWLTSADLTSESIYQDSA